MENFIASIAAAAIPTIIEAMLTSYQESDTDGKGLFASLFSVLKGGFEQN